MRWRVPLNVVVATSGSVCAVTVTPWPPIVAPRRRG